MDGLGEKSASFFTPLVTSEDFLSNVMVEVSDGHVCPKITRAGFLAGPRVFGGFVGCGRKHPNGLLAWVYFVYIHRV